MFLFVKMKWLQCHSVYGLNKSIKCEQNLHAQVDVIKEIPGYFGLIIYYPSLNVRSLNTFVGTSSVLNFSNFEYVSLEPLNCCEIVHNCCVIVMCR